MNVREMDSSEERLRKRIETNHETYELAIENALRLEGSVDKFRTMIEFPGRYNKEQIGAVVEDVDEYEASISLLNVLHGRIASLTDWYSEEYPKSEYNGDLIDRVNSISELLQIVMETNACVLKKDREQYAMSLQKYLVWYAN